MQGDLVLVELLPPRAQGPNAGKRAGRIVQIAHRRNPTVVGRFRYATSDRAQGNYVYPFDERMTQPILIPFGDEAPLYQDDDSGSEATPHRVLGEDAQHAEAAHLTPDDLEGLVVDVEITDWPTLHRQARGRVLEILGDPDDFGVDVEIMIRKHHIPHLFPDAVLENAKSVAPSRSAGDRPAARLPQPAHRHHRRRNCEGLRRRRPRQGNQPRLRASGPHRRCGAVRHARLAARPRSAPPRHLRLLSRSRRPHAAAGALLRHLQPPSR